jgi:hypothetical protein
VRHTITHVGHALRLLKIAAPEFRDEYRPMRSR